MDNTRIIKKVLYLFVTAIFAGFIFAGSACQAKQEFIVGFDAEFPPYGYMDENGDYTGFDLDLAEEVCKRKGWSLVKRPIKWDFKDSELDSGSISCLWNGFTMNGREGEYTWSTPYVDNSQVVITSSSSGIKGLKDLSGKIMAVQADSSALAALEGEDATDENKALAKSLKELQQVDDYNSAFMNLESGMVDAIAMDIGVASYQLSSKSDKFIMLDERLATEKYGIGFKSGNTELRDEVQLTLFEMLEDGTFEKIASKWGLQDSVCLSLEDTTYIDGSKVPVPGGDSADSGEVKQEDTGSTDNNSVIKADVPKVKKLSITQIIKQLSSGLAATVAIFVLTILFSMPLGLVIAAARMSKFKVIQWIAKIYISIMRGTPLMLQLIVVFFAPFYIFEVSTPYSYRFYAVIIGFSLNYAAYFAEIYRSGIQSIPQGQREAAQIMGYNRSQTFFRIIFPQMVKRVLPPVTNEVITLVKDTSLAFALSYAEMFTKAKQIAAAQTSLVPLFVAGVFYYIFNFIVAFIMERIEKRLDYYK
ncbi:MAG: ABC transporter permease subunit [Lachnospiraceae bacterium]|nr:ABC transporter permease subunit [Lachnospiraceae bacterium]